jgi:cleavage and polyadenylation specificity factor subunit 1
MCCDICQANKKSRIPKRVWQKFPITSRFKTVHVDLVGPLQKSTRGKIYIFTMIDRYSRWLEAVPLTNMKAIDCAESFYQVWVTRFGVPETVVSDQGTQFESFIYNDMLNRLGANHVRTTSYHPQANGKVERAHSTIKNMCLLR